MKRVIRWIGMAIVTAAVATMLFADMVLAAAPRDAVVVRFDLMSPRGMACAADAPGSQVSNSHDLFGKPMVKVVGDARAARIICTAPDGNRYRATAPTNADYTPSQTTWVTVAWRPGQDRILSIVELGDKTTYDYNSFVRVD